MKSLTLITLNLLTASVALADGPRASAESRLTVSAAVAIRAKLQLGVSGVSFADTDASTTPVINANENGSITVTSWVRTPRGTRPLLTVKAADDLKSGQDAIAISNVSFTASGASEYQAGALSKDEQTVATFQRSGRYDGSYNFKLQNSADYVPGNYSTQVVYTLVVP